VSRGCRLGIRKSASSSAAAAAGRRNEGESGETRGETRGVLTKSRSGARRKGCAPPFLFRQLFAGAARAGPRHPGIINRESGISGAGRVRPGKPDFSLGFIRRPGEARAAGGRDLPVLGCRRRNGRGVLEGEEGEKEER
jgi:hypothetical protein